MPLYTKWADQVLLYWICCLLEVPLEACKSPVLWGLVDNLDSSTWVRHFREWLCYLLHLAMSSKPEPNTIDCSFSQQSQGSYAIILLHCIKSSQNSGSLWAPRIFNQSNKISHYFSNTQACEVILVLFRQEKERKQLFKIIWLLSILCEKEKG